MCCGQMPAACLHIRPAPRGPGTSLSGSLRLTQGATAPFLLPQARVGFTAPGEDPGSLDHVLMQSQARCTDVSQVTKVMAHGESSLWQGSEVAWGEFHRRGTEEYPQLDAQSGGCGRVGVC